nr:hypothetical protein [Tanacetum cinerariifolium]
MDQTILKSHVEKPKKFKGSYFRRRQQKMLFYLTSLHVSCVLMNFEPTDAYLVDGQNVSTEAQVADYERVASQWNHNEYNCRFYILNALDDSTLLRNKWKNSKSLSIKMEVEGMGINSNFLVGCIIEKLPQSWNFFKLYLKHLTDDMNLEQLVLKIRVEEDNRMNEKADESSIESNAIMVGESSSKLKSNHKNKGKNDGDSRQKHYKDGNKD